MFTNEGSAATANEPSPKSSGPWSPQAPSNQPPDDGLYGEYQAQAQDAYEKAKAALQQKRAGIYQNFGFNADGSVNGLNFTGGYQQMKHAQALELQNAEHQARARHLGGRGLGAQIAEAPMFQEDADSADFGQRYLSALDSNSVDMGQAEADFQQALVDARRRQIEDDIANGRYDEASDPGTPDAPGTKAKAAAKKIVAAKKKSMKNSYTTGEKKYG